MKAIEPVFIEFNEASDAVLADDVDAIWQIPVPNRIVTDLTNKQPMRILDYRPGQFARLLADYPLYRHALVPAGAFPGQERDTAQIGVLNVCITHASVSEELIHGFVSTMVRETDMLAGLHHVYRKLGGLIGEIRTRGIAVFEPGGVPMHPGALRAYKDAGLLT
jgi:TRAP transporter TAXI family solute receptor